MKKNKFYILTLVLVSVLFIPRLVLATEIDTDEIIKKVAADGKTAVLKMKKPTTPEESDFVASGYISNILAGDGYYVFGTCEDNTCDVTFMSMDYEPEREDWDYEKNEPIYIPGTGWTRQYKLNVTYDPPKTNTTIFNFVNQFNKFDFMDPTTYYVIEDLALINYYLTSDKSELWNPLAPGRALKYSTINEVTKGSNITYYLDVRAGNQDESLMYESAFGPMSIFYNGYSYGAVEEGVYLRRVIYIPESTVNTTEAFAKAAQDRIAAYLGNDSVKVTYGGALSTLPLYSEDDAYPVEGNDGNYYNVTVGTKTYKFYIVKSAATNLKTPTYMGTDIDSNIQITSSVGSIPLDTSLTVKTVQDSSIKDKIGTDNYKSYDISLYSDAQSAKIEKLTNGKFLVKVPVPAELKGKDLIVYYITSNNKIEEHKVKYDSDKNYVTFETDHFSVYTLAQATSNPQTGDNISLYVIIFMLSFIGLISGLVIVKKNN